MNERTNERTNYAKLDQEMISVYEKSLSFQQI